jgi:GTPase
MDSQEYRSGFVGIVGAPNVGKSTLLNNILKEKVAITSDKPQTTRHRILGVWTSDRAQIIFQDTPGIHQADNLLSRGLVGQALAVLPDVDVVVFLTQPHARADDERLVIKALEEAAKTVLLVINKIDRVAKPDLLPLMDQYRKILEPAAIVPVSALTGEHVDILLEEIVAHLPSGPRYYPEDTLTDQPERFIAAEMIREQVFRLTGREIPYATAVTVESFKETERLVRISATIHVERDSQKKIVIGAKGSKLKQIGTAARRDIEQMTGTKVFLELFVRVWKNWTKDPRAIREFGYEPKS